MRAAARCLPQSRPGPGQRVHGRGWYEVADALQEARVGAHERALLELRERDVLGLAGRVQVEPVRDLPGPPAEDGVPEQTDLERIDVPQPRPSLIVAELAATDGLVRAESISERQSVGACSSFPGDTSTPHPRARASHRCR